MITTYKEVIAAIIEKKISVLPVMDKWHKLSGDVNALEYGHTYVRGDDQGFNVYRFSGRDWSGYSQAKLYHLSEYSIDLIGLASSFGGYSGFGGLDLDDHVDDVSSAIMTMLGIVTLYIIDYDDSSCDTNASRLLGFNPDTRPHVPSVCCEVIE